MRMTVCLKWLDRAGSNSEQTLFFEAMRALRWQRPQDARLFPYVLMRELKHSIWMWLERAPAKDATQFRTPDSLSLVQPDELEETVRSDKA